MGRRKKDDLPAEAKRPTFVEVALIQGPRDGERLRVSNPPPERLVLAEPEWAVYERVGTNFQYAGEGKYAYLNEKMRQRKAEHDSIGD